MTTSPTIYCDNCGGANHIQARQCRACKQPLHTTSPFTPSPPGKPFRGPLPQAYLLQQRYSIVAQVGTGGFGAVYKAEDTLFSNRHLAIKELNQDGLSPRELAEATAAIQHEVLLLAQLSHPNLPRIHSQFVESGRSYVVMDFIEGDTLEDYLERVHSRLPLEEVLDIGIQLCSVLDYLHTHQPPIVFRDVKPANIMRALNGHVYLIDFGIARHFKPGKARDTIPLGSTGYAAPEQYGKAQTSAQTDIYGLGATLHQLLTGDDPSLTPFRFEPLKGRKSPIAAQLDDLLRQMVEMDMSKRPKSISVVRQELQDLLARQMIQQLSPLQKSLQAVVGRRRFLSGLGGVFAACGASVAVGALLSQHFTTPQQYHPFNTTALFSRAGTPTAPPAGTFRPLFTPLYTYRDHQGGVTVVAWSPNGSNIASADVVDDTVRVWDSATGATTSIYPCDPNTTSGGGQCTKIPAIFGAGDQRVDSLAWSPDGSYIASALDNDTVQMWNLEAGGTSFTLAASPGKGNALTWSPDGSLIAAASGPSSVQAWSTTTKNSSFSYTGLAEGVSAIAWSPNGRLIATGSIDGSVNVWEVASRHTLFTYHGHLEAVSAVTWSSDNQYIASGSVDGTVQIWSVLTRGMVYTYRGHAGPVNTVEWSPDALSSLPGHSYRVIYRVASGGADATVQVWSVTTSTGARSGQTMTISGNILVYRGHSDQVISLSWAPDGMHIASGSQDGTVQIWQAV